MTAFLAAMAMTGCDDVPEAIKISQNTGCTTDYERNGSGSISLTDLSLYITTENGDTLNGVGTFYIDDKIA